MTKLTIDGQEVEVSPGTTVLQAAQTLGIEIPHFCYHERLAVAGNCRMCLVEQEKSWKPVASCAMPAAEGMVIHTNSEKARKARQGVMEFLLINHPLDCPICDQGGECDLQDQAVAYGGSKSRFEENKRAVTDKDFGPLVKTIMTRCIQCTRCVRFATEIAGVEDLGAVNRGEHMEIDTYVERTLTSELSGNLIDLCPVGALTSKPYAFVARPWELRKTESVDVLDATGANIRIDSRGPQVMRVLPRLNEEVNEEWLADKSRFAIDGLTQRRLDRPYVRRGGKLVAASWTEAFRTIADRLGTVSGSRIAGVAGDLVDVESVLALKDLLTALGSVNLDCRQHGEKLDPSARAGYIFNTTIAGIEKADAVLLIGTNPRWEAPLVNARLRKRYLARGFRVGAVGPALDLTFPVDQLGADPTVLTAIAAGQHEWSDILRDAKNPALILGAGALSRKDGAQILALARAIAEKFGLLRADWNGFNLLHRAAGRVGALDVGFVPGEGGRDLEGILAGAESGEIEAVYLLGADEIDTARLGRAFVIYQGHHGDRGAARADVVLPGAAFTEKNGTWVNTEGRVQRGRLAVLPPGEAREDWKIVRALSETLGRKLPYDTLEQLRARLEAVNPLFKDTDTVQIAPWQGFGVSGPVDPAAFDYPVKDYYLTDPISRASATMEACSANYRDQCATTAKTGTNG